MPTNQASASASGSAIAAADPPSPGTPVADPFRMIAELHGDVCFVVDCATLLPTYVSPAIDALLGCPAQDLLRHLGGEDGGPLAAVWGGLPARLARFAQGDLSRLDLVRRIEQPHPDGSLVALEVRSRLQCDAHGKAVALVGMLRDVSAERERAQQQRRFTSMLNHEFRTPLSTIDGAVQRLEATGANADEPTRLRYRKIQTAVDRLIAMLDDYLSPDRLDEVGRTRVPDGAAPCQLLDEAAAQVRAAGRQVSVDCSDLPASLRCQPQGLRLALKVLVDNALQYGPEDGVIALSGRWDERGIVLSVGDTGAGVPAGEAGAIFDKGVRGSNASGPGAGRGLYMARSVIEVHGGHISVESVAPTGATFKIWLPAQRASGKRVASDVINSDNSANQHTREGAVRRD